MERWTASQFAVAAVRVHSQAAPEGEARLQNVLTPTTTASPRCNFCLRLLKRASSQDGRDLAVHVSEADWLSQILSHVSPP